MHNNTLLQMAVQMKNMKASLGDLHITSAIENINKEVLSNYYH